MGVWVAECLSLCSVWVGGGMGWMDGGSVCAWVAAHCCIMYLFVFYMYLFIFTVF